MELRLVTLSQTGLELSLRSNSLNDRGFEGDYDSYAFMANGIYDFPISSQFKPYIGAGIGLVHLGDGDLDDQVLGYQLLAGISYNISESTDFVVGYRYLDTEDAKFKDDGIIIDASYQTQNIEVGFRFNF